jgi:hypothetical protein
MKLTKIFSGLKTFWNKLTGKKIGPEYFNVYHPDFVGHVEPAFQVNGKQYYRFAKETEMKWSRYMILQTFLHEQRLRIDMELLKGYIIEMKKALSGSLKQGIDLNRVHRIVSQLESRCELAFEAETTYRLASIIYFDDQEDLYGYDKTHNDKKIVSWKGAKCLDFFYTKPMSELLGLTDLSPRDLQIYMEQSQELLKELTIETPEP